MAGAGASSAAVTGLLSPGKRTPLCHSTMRSSAAGISDTTLNAVITQR